MSLPFKKAGETFDEYGDRCKQIYASKPYSSMDLHSWLYTLEKHTFLDITDDDRQEQLEYMAVLIEQWLEHSTKEYDQSGIVPDYDSHVTFGIGSATHGQMKNWIEVLRNAS